MSPIAPPKKAFENTGNLEVSSPAEQKLRARAILLMCLALVCFALLDTTGKLLGRHTPVWEIVWCRYVSATLLTLLFINPWKTPRMMATQRPLLQTFRALLLFGSTAFNFFALRYLQLAETMSIAFAMPLVVSLLAGPMLGEWVGPRRLIAIAIGFLGVLVVVRPGLGGMHPAALYSVAALLCYAFYNMFTRMLAATDPTTTTTVFSALSGVVILTPLLPWFWVWPESPWVWVGLCAVGLFGGFGHYLLILAHGLAPASVLAPFVYTQIIWMIALGYVVFDETPGPFTLLGGAIVISSGLYLFYRDRTIKAHKGS